jgi:hypothetical protein
LAHYLEGSGTTREIDLDRLIQEVKSARGTFEAQMADAIVYSMDLKDGEHFHATRTIPGRMGKKESPNWYFAIAGYRSWSDGRVQGCGTDRTVFFRWNIFDEYNFNYGDEATVDGLGLSINVKDEQLIAFHRMGLAKNYDTRGKATRQIILKAGKKPEIKKGWLPL